MKTFLILLLLSFNIYADDTMIDNSGHENKVAEKLKAQLNQQDLDFRLVDQYGIGFSLADYFNKNEILILQFHPHCDANKLLKKAENLKDLNKKSRKIIPLISDPKISRESLVQNFPKTYIGIDDNQQISNSFKFNKVGDYAIIDSATQQIKKMGHIDIGKKGNTACENNIETYREGTFAEEVLPALRRSCISCHAIHNNLSYFKSVDTIKAWQQMMLRTIRFKRMPPGGDPYYGALTAQFESKDIFIITKWLEAGKFDEPGVVDAYAHSTEKLKQFRKSLISKVKGEPLVLFSLPPEEVKESGSPFYKHYTTKTPTTKDYYFRLFNIKVNENVAHHIALHFSPTPFPEVDKNGNSLLPKNSMNAPTTALYGNFPETISGKSSIGKIKGYKFKDPNIIHISRISGFQKSIRDTIYHIPKGSYLNLEVHYSPSGKNELSKNELTIYSDDTLSTYPAMKRFSMTPDSGVVVAMPNEKKSLVEMRYTLTEPIYLEGYGLHMHYRGRSGQLLYRLPREKSNKMAFSFPTYQYKLQVTSHLQKSLFLPKGTEIISRIIYDNSKENFANPDSETSVKIGGSILLEENYLPRILYTER